MRARLWLGALAVCVGVAPAPALAAGTEYSLLDFSDLSGWKDDDHDAALTAFLETCGDMDAEEWGPLCAFAGMRPDARTFFELFFRPVLAEDGAPARFTGYFEPELRGSLTPTARYRYPLYRKPPEASGAWLTRAEIETGNALKGRGLEICWVDDPVELFFLQIQGSGRVRLPDGGVIRVGYGGENGRPYRSVGAELVRRGTYRPHQVSARVIQSWVRRNPVAGPALLRHNPSYVFFRRVQVAEDKGPLGAMNRSVTALRTVAVDPAHVPLGAPVWVEKRGGQPMNRLMVAQDTGSAIRGAQRADIFFGSGERAGMAARRVRDGGRMVMLLPIRVAFRLVPEGV